MCFSPGLCANVLVYLVSYADRLINLGLQSFNTVE